MIQGRRRRRRTPLLARRVRRADGRHVGDAGAGQRRAEAAVVEPEVHAADELPVALRQRGASRGVAGRQAREDAEADVVADIRRSRLGLLLVLIFSFAVAAVPGPSSLALLHGGTWCVPCT